MKRLFLLFFLLLPTLLFAQYEVEFFDDPDEVEIIIDGFEYPVEFGLNLLTGDAIYTQNSTVELWNPNSYVLIDRNTDFVINDVCIENSDISVRGRIRVILDRITGEFQFRTQTAVVGVRGTDFILESFDQRDSLFVLDGSVEFEVESEIIIVESGQTIDSDTMIVREMTGEEREKFELLEFRTVRTGQISLKTFNVILDDTSLSLRNLERQINDFITPNMEIIEIDQAIYGNEQIIYLWYRVD